MTKCKMCSRVMDPESTNPLDNDCGGDCWGCVGQVELDYEPSLIKVVQEVLVGYRENNPAIAAAFREYSPSFLTGLLK